MNRMFTKEDTRVVKGVAVLCMLFYHLFQTAELVEKMGVVYAPLSLDGLLLISGFGNICVAIFVFLSAYGLSRGFYVEQMNFGRLPEMLRYATRRGAKLCLHFSIMFITINLIWFSKFDYGGLYGKNKQGVLYLLLDMFGLAEVFDTPTLNATWWYMEIAILMVFLVPILYLIVEKLGWYVLFPAILLPLVFALHPDFQRYYFVMIMGVVAAKEGWIEKLLNWKLPFFGKAVLGVAGLVFCVLVRQNYVVYTYFAYLFDAPIALFMIWFCTDIIGRSKILRFLLNKLGTHSMNIYFVHTFFYMAIYQKEIYSFKYTLLILAVLVFVCYIFSVVLEFLKRLIFRRIPRWRS